MTFRVLNGYCFAVAAAAVITIAAAGAAIRLGNRREADRRRRKAVEQTAKLIVFGSEFESMPAYRSARLYDNKKELLDVTKP